MEHSFTLLRCEEDGYRTSPSGEGSFISTMNIRNRYCADHMLTNNDYHRGLISQLQCKIHQGGVQKTREGDYMNDTDTKNKWIARWTVRV